MMKKFLVASVSAAAVLAPSLASAAIDEVVVTAERREASLQSVPVAVTAFDSSSLESLQIDSVRDLGASVPNLQTTAVTAGGMAMQVHMRGASVQNPGFTTSESPVGIYQDGVYRGRLATSSMEFTDVERIEVLRGPQGTLYGRNTIAGAINVISKTPGDESWANIELGYGDYDTYVAKGSVGAPITEGKLAASASIVYHNQDEGYITNPALGRDVGRSEDLAARAKLHYYGHEDIDAVFTVWAFDSDNDGWNGIPYGPSLGVSGWAGSMDPFDPPVNTGIPTAGPGGFYTQLTPFESKGDSEEIGVSADISWDLGFGTLRSITAYSDTEDAFDFDLSGGYALGVPGLGVESSSENEQFSQEFLLQGEAANGALDWTTGVFYLKEEGEQLYGVSADLGGGFSQFLLETTDNETESYAVFAQATYDVTDRLSVTGGIRWTREEKQFNYDVNGFSNPKLDVSYEDVTSKITVDYQLNDEILVYATVAEGYQSGGFQGLCFGDPVCASIPYGPQDVLSYEIGAKADLFDNRLRINVALFDAQYDDIQQTALVMGAFPLTNVGEVDVQGFELEVIAEPIDGLTLFANLGLADEDFGDLDPTSPSAGLADPQLPGLPETTARVGFEYDTGNLGNTSLGLRFGADYIHSDEYYSEITNALLIDDYGRTNAFIALAPEEGNWEFRFEGNNITDEEDNVSGIFGNGVNMRTIQPPSTWMASVKFNF